MTRGHLLPRPPDVVDGTDASYRKHWVHGSYRCQTCVPCTPCWVRHPRLSFVSLQLSLHVDAFVPWVAGNSCSWRRQSLFSGADRFIATSSAAANETENFCRRSMFNVKCFEDEYRGSRISNCIVTGTRAADKLRFSSGDGLISGHVFYRRLSRLAYSS